MRRFVPALAAPLLLATTTAATGLGAGDTLLCRVPLSGATCALWLLPAGRYVAFFDSGKKAYVTGLAGAFEFEGQEGRYTLRLGSAVTLCLAPDAPDPPRRFSRAPHLFHDPGCVTLPRLASGQTEPFHYKDQDYDLGIGNGR